MELERCAVRSLRPSQYAGWEIGSTANRILNSGEKGMKRLGLLWPAAYPSAMKDPFFLETYGLLALVENIWVERFFLPSEDFRELLVSKKLPEWISLESKSPLEDFDAFIIYSADPKMAENRAEYLQGLGKKVFQANAAGGARETLESAFFSWQWPLTLPEKAAELIGYSSGGGREDKQMEKIAHKMPVRFSGFVPRSFSYRVRLQREGWARFLSHLEQIQMIKAASRLAGLPLALSGAKSPKAKISFGPAISVGWASEAEYFDIDLVDPMEAAELQARLQRTLSLGYQVSSVKRIPRHFPSLEESVNWVEFFITARRGVSVSWQPLLDFSRQLETGNAPQMSVRKEKPGKKVDVIDLSEVIASASVARNARGEEGVSLSLRFAPKKNLKPEKILEVLLNLDPEIIKQDLLISRTALALEAQGKLRYL